MRGIKSARKEFLVNLIGDSLEIFHNINTNLFFSINGLDLFLFISTNSFLF